LDLVLSDLGAEFTVVPLVGAGIAASILIQDHLLAGPVAGVEPDVVQEVPQPVVPPVAEPAAQDVVQDVVQPTTQPVVQPIIEPVIEPVTAPGVQPGAPMGAPVGGFGAPAPSAGASVSQLPPRRGIEMLHGVDMEVTVELGRTRMTVRDLLALTPGAVLELDRAAGSPADLLVNGRLIARGEVVVVDEDFGLRVTEIVDDSAAV
jgi:flagellar motor switch protein FliN/FliY